MSTRLTDRGTPMVESQALKLALGAGQVNEIVSRHLSSSLLSRGYKHATPSALIFLSRLECGVNYGSEIARNLGVTRQMVAKNVKGLCSAGYLEQVDDVGKQKKIIFTEAGELLMSDARQLLADLDKVLIAQLGDSSIATAIENLDSISTLVSGLSVAVPGDVQAVR